MRDESPRHMAPRRSNASQFKSLTVKDVEMEHLGTQIISVHVLNKVVNVENIDA